MCVGGCIHTHIYSATTISGTLIIYIRLIEKIRIMVCVPQSPHVSKNLQFKSVDGHGL